AEASRRLLASAQRPAEPVSKSARGVVIGAAFGAPILALAIYFAVGAPGTPDQPFLKRVKEWQTNPTGRSPAELAATIASMHATKKDDPAFWRNLAIARMMAGQNDLAAEAARQGVGIAPNDANLWSLLGRARLGDADLVSASARSAFEQAQALEPGEQYSTYYLGLADVQAGRIPEGLALWRGMLATLPPGALAEGLRGQIDAVQATGKLPAAQPSGDDVAQAAAAGGVDVNAMVARLAGELKAKPDNPDGWVRLIRSYTVLGKTAERDDALNQARRIFAGRKDVMSAIEQAAVAQQ
ncbi:MAG: ccmI, partial [Caulobacteraceae bacterium]|nr:ccmI [Caulobacteraceae bacterium]